MSRTKAPPVGDLVRDLRKRLGLSQRRAAELAGIQREQLSRIENNANKASSHEMRRNLARAFGLTLDAFDSYLSRSSSLEDVVPPAREAA